jgi:hypothetical protein
VTWLPAASAGTCGQEHAPALADKLFEVIRANRHRIFAQEQEEQGTPVST